MSSVLNSGKQVVQVSGSKTFVLAGSGNPLTQNVPEFNSLSAIVEGSNIGVRVQGLHLGGVTEDWFDLPPIGNRGELLHWEVSEPGVYHWDLRAVNRIRVIRTSGSNDDFRFHGALSALEAPPAANAMEFGWNRFRVIRAEDGRVDEEFCAIMALTDCELHSSIRFARRTYLGSPAAAGFLATDVLPAGMTIPAPFDRVQVTSGTLLAYYLL